MNATIEQLETVRIPLANITTVIWRDGELVGIHRIEIATPFGVVRIGGAV